MRQFNRRRYGDRCRIAPRNSGPQDHGPQGSDGDPGSDLKCCVTRAGSADRTSPNALAGLAIAATGYTVAFPVDPGPLLSGQLISLTARTGNRPGSIVALSPPIRVYAVGDRYQAIGGDPEWQVDCTRDA